MKLEQNEKQLLFSETVVPDIFFAEYLPQLPGDYMKIYFYMVFLSKYKTGFISSAVSGSIIDIGLFKFGVYLNSL